MCAELTTAQCSQYALGSNHKFTLTSGPQFLIILAMKWQTIIVVVAIAFSVLSPLSVHLTIEYGQTSIGTFDVCHAGSLAVSANHEILCITGDSSGLIPLRSTESAAIPSAVRKLLIIASQEERPPKA